MKLTDFEEGDTVRQSDFFEGFYWVYSESKVIVNSDGEHAKVTMPMLYATNWEYYMPTKKEGPKETWYRFEYKVKDKHPVSDIEWFQCRNKYMAEFNSGIIFDVAPRVYEEREF